MTGLYENIEDLQNEKTLTFLYRAPKIQSQALNIGAIAANYEKKFPLNSLEALEMARTTEGYSFAFQVLGYTAWENGGFNENAVHAFRVLLEESVYKKLWSELSQTDKDVCYALASCKTGKIKDIRDILGFDNNHMNPYRKRLIRKGILSGTNYGYVSFTLPMFDRFVIENYTGKLYPAGSSFPLDA